MEHKNQRNFRITGLFFMLFLLWTVAISYVDVQAIGPKGSFVGFATFNGFFHNLTGVHMSIYTITDWLSLVPLLIVLGFAMLGLMQWVKRKKLLKVDHDILVLGGFYVLVMSAYALFEVFIINYRPILINGYLEASYPSSTTILTICVMLTAIMQFRERIKNRNIEKFLECVGICFTIFMVIGRLVSGVHWLTDIIGGILLSVSLLMAYYSVNYYVKQFNFNV